MRRKQFLKWGRAGGTTAGFAAVSLHCCQVVEMGSSLRGIIAAEWSPGGHVTTLDDGSPVLRPNLLSTLPVCSFHSDLQELLINGHVTDVDDKRLVTNTGSPTPPACRNFSHFNVILTSF